MLYRPLAAAALVAASLPALAADPRATLADLDARLAKIGTPKVDGRETVAGRDVPALYFGTRKLNGNHDVVDAVRRTHAATATVFVKDGDEFVRVSTNVLTPEGKRGVGTALARNAAYAALAAGTPYCGKVDVLGTTYDACYGPIKGADGRVLGATYVGHKQ